MNRISSHPPIDQDINHIDIYIEELRGKIAKLKMQFADELNLNIRFKILMEINQLEN